MADEQPGAADEDDANGSRPNAQVGEFSCDFDLSLTTHNFVRFL
jgi:hypothetical protein